MAFSSLLLLRRAREVRRGRDAENAAGTALLYESKNAARGPSRFDGNRGVEPTRRSDATSGEEAADDSRVREAPARVLSARDLRNVAVLDDREENVGSGRGACNAQVYGTRGVGGDSTKAFVSRTSASIARRAARSSLPTNSVRPSTTICGVSTRAEAPEARGVRTLALRVRRGTKTGPSSRGGSSNPHGGRAARRARRGQAGQKRGVRVAGRPRDSSSSPRT